MRPACLHGTERHIKMRPMGWMGMQVRAHRSAPAAVSLAYSAGWRMASRAARNSLPSYQLGQSSGS